ncbi:MAG: alpha-L-fucosidase [Candidatus Glassbacteria bacterium]|nr:alpha-L-fucosidase [Candidatus Glassbacteria bacterium]
MRRLTPLSLLLVLLTAPAFTPVTAETGYVPSAENIEAREWFRDAGYGMFVHWGVYSVLGRGEWVMHNEDIPIEEYEKLPVRFNPVNFDPDSWCELVKKAGMRYITITSKHHDGFAMFGSRHSEYDVVDAAPYGRDILEMLAGACRRHGLKLFFYHSQLDWHHPDYWPRGGSYAHGRPESGDWNSYLDYMDSQLSELLTNYGPVGGIWFDGMWEKPDADWRLERTYGLIHRLQPAALVGSNHHVAPFPGEDFQMFEKGLPGQDPYNKGSGISDLPLEMCQTINNSWGYDQRDKKAKSVRELVHTLARAAGYGANLLLNVGPRPDGTIQEDHRQRLLEVGEWLERNGEAIYRTRKGPCPPQSWGAATISADGRKVYVHVLDESARVVALPVTELEIARARTLDGAAVDIARTDIGTLVRLPAELSDPYDRIVVLELN